MPGKPAVRAVIFDLDGVVRHWDAAVMRGAEADAGLPSGALSTAVLGDAALLRLAITGGIDDAEWRRRIATGLTGLFGAAGALAVEQWSASCGAVVPDVLELVRWTRARARASLLSNATSRLGDDLAALGLHDEFDDVFNTSALGVAKPDPAVFAAVGRALQLEAADCVLVDDSKANVEGAQSCGMRAHLFTSAPQLDCFLRECFEQAA